MDRQSLLVAALAVLAWPTAASADCSQALITSTYQRLSQSSQNWQLATLVTEETYNRLKTDAGGSGVIYGIPMGSSFSQFRQNLANRLSSRRESWSASEMQNVLWTGLDPNAATAYRACLDAQVFNQNGLQAAVIGASDSNILIRVRWNVPGQTTPATVTWTSPAIENQVLRTSFPHGETTIQVPRPSTSLMLAGSYGGYSTQAIAIEPLPAAPSELSLAQKIRMGRTFIFVSDPGTTLGNLQSIPHAGFAWSYPITTGFYRHVNRSWSAWASAFDGSYHSYYSGTWCGQDSCGPPAVPLCSLGTIFAPGNPAARCQNIALRLTPSDNLTGPTTPADPLAGEIAIFGKIMRFDADGRVFSHDNVQRGFVFVPEFATEAVPDQD